MQSRYQSGQGKLGAVIWLVILLAAGTVGWKVIPIKIKNAEFKDFMKEQAKTAARLPADRIKTHIFNRAKDLGLPVKKKDIIVEKRAGDRIRIHCSYTVVLNFPGYTYEWPVETEIDEAFYIF